MRIGVIGIRSKHLAFFNDALSRLFPDGQHTITHICGLDAPELVGNWPDMVHCIDPQELIASVDAVIVALREGYQHAALATMAMQAGKPVFIDKPFTCNPAEAATLAALSAETGIPCTGGSTICFTEKVRQLQKQLPPQAQYTLSYQADPFTPFGGWYFYGSHMTDLCAALFGGQWQSVTASQTGGSITARVQYPEYEVIIKTSLETQQVLLTADQVYSFDDHGCYEAGMAHFIAVAEGREAGVAPTLVHSTELLKGILTSLRVGQPYHG